jgi:lipopolysaccharide transport system permease protein
MERSPVRSRPTQVIRPITGWGRLGLLDVWRHRELLLVFTWRNILVRYKQTVLGPAWAVLQPLFFMVVFTIFFGRLAGLNQRTHGIPYPVFTYAALVPWTFFANALGQSSMSLVANSNLLRKIYFPRLIIPLSVILTALVDFMIAFLVLVVLMVVYGVHPDPVRLLALPALVVLAVITALGAGLWLSSLNVAYRDIQYAVPFLLQIWLFVSFVIYPASIVPEPWRTLAGLNPMAGVIEGFRWALLNDQAPGPLLAVGVVVAVLLLLSGAAYFARTERRFADIV